MQSKSAIYSAEVCRLDFLTQLFRGPGRLPALHSISPFSLIRVEPHRNSQFAKSKTADTDHGSEKVDCLQSREQLAQIFIAIIQAPTKSETLKDQTLN